MFLISIHAPSRERLGERFGKLVVIEISIHDPSRERLWTITIRFDSGMYFNPRSLTGATARRFTRFNCRVLFQSTLPYGSDIVRQRNRHCIGISIHAPSRERPSACVRNILLHIYFNPRSLTGATVVLNAATAKNFISIHAPSRERHIVSSVLQASSAISIHAPSRERPITAYQLRQCKPFQSTLPHGSDLPVEP